METRQPGIVRYLGGIVGLVACLVLALAPAPMAPAEENLNDVSWQSELESEAVVSFLQTNVDLEKQHHLPAVSLLLGSTEIAHRVHTKRRGVNTVGVLIILIFIVLLMSMMCLLLTKYRRDDWLGAMNKLTVEAKNEQASNVNINVVRSAGQVTSGANIENSFDTAFVNKATMLTSSLNDDDIRKAMQSQPGISNVNSDLEKYRQRVAEHEQRIRQLQAGRAEYLSPQCMSQNNLLVDTRPSMTFNKDEEVVEFSAPPSEVNANINANMRMPVVRQLSPPAPAFMRTS